MSDRLKHLLRGKHVDVWAAFAAEIGGTWNDPSPGEQARIEVAHPHGPVVIQADASMILVGKVMVPVLSTVFTALRPTARPRRFSVSRANFATSVAEWFGSLDIHVDDATFDQQFVLKGETPDFVRAVFADAALRERYQRDFSGQLALRDDKVLFSDPTPGFDPLELTLPGYVEEVDTLRALYTLFVATLDRIESVAAV
ncbi:MAG: hypothetical protein K2R93_10535 [Gemmatimonadaceae bacterium]|nr:hypothetical protein [Gemmatimonadaceae bacterium]